MGACGKDGGVMRVFRFLMGPLAALALMCVACGCSSAVTPQDPGLIVPDPSDPLPTKSVADAGSDVWPADKPTEVNVCQGSFSLDLVEDIGSTGCEGRPLMVLDLTGRTGTVSILNPGGSACVYAIR